MNINTLPSNCNVLIVGAGSIGSRYVQGLANIRKRLHIQVIDSSRVSLEVAEQRWLEISSEKNIHQIEWLLSTSDAFDSVDLIVISTTARGRAALLCSLLEKITTKYCILEKVLAQSSLELDAISEVTSSIDGCWVNTPRRISKWHNQLKAIFAEGRPIQVVKSGGLWGLACNSIHFIDLVTWWTGETLIAIDAAGLQSNWFKSKRQDFFEVSGTLVAHYSNGSKLTLISDAAFYKNSLEVELASGDRWSIDESNGYASSTSGSVRCGRLEAQSELTKPLVTEILASGECGLPTLKESVVQHRIYLETMLSHWNRSLNRSDQTVPIT